MAKPPAEWIAKMRPVIIAELVRWLSDGGAGGGISDGEIDRLLLLEWSFVCEGN